MPFQPPPSAPPPSPWSAPPGAAPGRAAGAPPPPAGPPGWTPAMGTAQVTAGTLIQRTFQVWWRNLGKLAGLTVLFYVPFFVLFGALGAIGAMKQQAGAPPDPSSFGLVFGVVGAGMLVLVPISVVILGGLSYGVIRWLAHKPASVGDMLGQGFRRIGTLLVTAVLVGLAFVGGYILLIIPGIMVAMATSVALPAATVEKIGPVDAFKRSLALTRGSRWAIFAALFVVTAVGGLVGLVGTLLQLANVWLGLAVSLAVQVTAGSLGWVLPAVAYHDLRVVKEGADTADLARVFE